MNPEKKTIDWTPAGGQDAAGELTEGALEQVSGGARTAGAAAPVLQRPDSRGTETD